MTGSEVPLPPATRQATPNAFFTQWTSLSGAGGEREERQRAMLGQGVLVVTLVFGADWQVLLVVHLGSWRARQYASRIKLADQYD